MASKIDFHFENKMDDTYYLAKQLFLEGYSLTSIEKQLPIGRKKLSSLLKYEGYEIKRGTQKYNYNESIFEAIDSCEKAYWLGFLYADGNIRVIGQKILSLSLCEKDVDHLKRFAKFVIPNGDYRIEKRVGTLPNYDKEYVSYRFMVYNAKIVDDIIKLGCLPEKTFIISFPTMRPEYHRHFIRGYFDGDGTAAVRTTSGACAYFIGASQEFMTTIERVIACGAKTTKRNICTVNKKGRATLYGIGYYSCEDNKKIYDYFYRDTDLFLKRKFDLLHNRVMNAPSKRNL